MNPRKKLPAFFCIGLYKSGTTWLYRNLSQHPQVYLTPFKELSYFWEKYRLSDGNLVKRLTDSHWHYHRLRRYMKTRFKFYCKNFLHMDKNYIHTFIWDFKFFFFPHTDNWYFSLFKEGEGKVIGDISPSYSELPEEMILKISKLLPDLKVIILLRNPIDRIWSAARMNLDLKPNNIEDIPEEQFQRYFDRTFNIIPSYLDLINRWSKYLPEKNIYVAFFDKLKQAPLKLFQEICRFLEIDFSKFPAAARKNLKQKVFVGPAVNIPEKYAAYLARLSWKSITEMCEYYEPYPQIWREGSSTILSKDNLEKGT